jgi:sterol desaturase/sphingolipid hydroxylase (fatty acid hydroxylase superfamily)
VNPFRLQSWEDALRLALGLGASDGFWYALLAGITWLLCYVVFRRRWLQRKVVAHFPARSEVRREMGYSLLTLVIFSFVGVATFWAVKQGWTRVYWRLDAHSGAWFWGSVALTVVLHDAYFYWTHRLMHHRKLFRWFHRTHHRSHNPSPWAAYAFDPLEAVVQAGIFPLAVCLYPIHPAAFGLFMLWQIIHNVLGHNGYEIYPRWLMDTFLGKILNTPTNHVMHHEFQRGNYGLYFNVWDRLMGTNHERYEARFREVTSRASAAAGESGVSLNKTATTPVP